MVTTVAINPPIHTPPTTGQASKFEDEGLCGIVPVYSRCLELEGNEISECLCSRVFSRRTASELEDCIGRISFEGGKYAGMGGSTKVVESNVPYSEFGISASECLCSCVY